jgi:hypothetical protein
MHGALFGIVVLIAALGGFAYLLIARVRGRAQRHRSGDG